MESVKVSDNCKKSLIAPYQQSFRIDDLLTRKVIDQQPGLLPHHSITALQSPPVGLLSGHHHHHHHHLHNMENPPHIDISAISGAAAMHRANYANGKSLNGKTSESGNCEENCKDATKRSYSSTSNEEDDDLYQKRKKPRTAFSREQVADLEKKFQDKKYLSSAERGELAEKLKLSDMQVKTWFQNRRMKYKRQSEEAEMEMKSPKYPYSPFMSYGGVSPFYSYVPMPYKPHDGSGSNITPYNYSSSAAAAALRSPQTTSPISGGGGVGGGGGGMDANFVMNSPTMLGSLSSPLSAGISPRHHGLPTPLPRPNGGTSYFNGLLTPISPSTSYQHGYFANESALSGNHTQIHGFSDWPRVVTAPASP